MFTILDYSSALEYSIIRRYTNIVYYYIIRKKLFKIVDTLLGRNKQTTLPKYDSPLTMASVMKKNFLIRLIIFELSFHY